MKLIYSYYPLPAKVSYVRQDGLFQANPYSSVFLQCADKKACSLNDGGAGGIPVSLFRERLRPVVDQHFPIGTTPKIVKKMIVTMFRQRVPIQPLSPQCFEDYDLVILAGPT
jgi:hypothetical protein